jgi:hypothetical protein
MSRVSASGAPPGGKDSRELKSIVGKSKTVVIFSSLMRSEEAQTHLKKKKNGGSCLNGVN